MTARFLTTAAMLSTLTATAPALRAQSTAADRLFAAGHTHYAEQRFAEAAVAYRAALDADGSLAEAHYYLANSLDNLFSPGRRGQPANDRLLEDAREHYETAAALLVRPDQAPLLKSSLQFLAALYHRDKLNRPADAEPAVRRLVDLEPTDVGSYAGLVRIYEDAGRPADAEAVLIEAQNALPTQKEVWTQTAQFFNRQGRFDEAVAALARLTQVHPADPQHFFQLAVFYEEKVRKDASLQAAQQHTYLAAGMDAVDQALALRPEYFEALVYKNLLLRQQARFATDPQAQRTMLDDADRLQREAIAVRDQRVRGTPRP
jgi:tetratricopeptide (TPR) repeat protein